MKKRNKKSGFTLIELVVVIAIIGILAAVITPRIRMALYKARDAKAVAALDALRTASNVYFAEKGVALGNPGSVLSSANVDDLYKSGYIDEQTKTKLQTGTKDASYAGTTSNAILIDAGTVAKDAQSGCPNGSPSPLKVGKLLINFTNDGVGMVFGGWTQDDGATIASLPSGSVVTTTYVDTACNPWNSK